MANNRDLQSINHKLQKGIPILQDTVRALLDERLSVSVLEIGCGAGRALMELAWAFRNQPVDFCGINKEPGRPLRSPDDLRRTAMEYGILPGEELDALTLPKLFFYDATQLHFDDCSFDLVYSSSVVRFIPRKAEFLEEICRVLRPGGVALVRVSSRGWDYPYSLADNSMRLTPYCSRFVVKHDRELVPLETVLAPFADQGYTFEFINRPACVLRIAKRTTGRIALNLRYNPLLSVGLRQLPYGEDEIGDVKGGVRSVYELSDADYEALLARGQLSRGRLVPSDRVPPSVRREQPVPEKPAAGRTGYTVGQRVKIKGRREGPSSFRAAKIRPNEDGHEWDELESAVEWVSQERRAFGMMGFEVRLREGAETVVEKAALAGVEPGVTAKVSGVAHPGHFVAERLVVKETPAVLVEEIQGRVEAVDIELGTIQVAGFLVRTAKHAAPAGTGGRS